MNSCFQKKRIIFHLFKANQYFCVHFFEEMTNKYEETIAAFEQKLRKIMSAYQLLQKENSELKEELERKHNDLMRAHKDVLTLQKDYEQLRIARSLVASDDAHDAAKQSVTKLIREIDKCLALLND